MYLVFRGAAFILGSVLAGALALLTAGAVVAAFGGRALAVCSTSLATHVVF